MPYSPGATVCLPAALSGYCVGQPQNVAGGLCWLRLPLEKGEVVKALNNSGIRLSISVWQLRTAIRSLSMLG